MHDFKYRKLITGGPEWKAHMKELGVIRSKELRTIASAFIENIGRTNSAAIAPAMIAWKVRRDQVLSDCAMVKAKGKLEPDLIQFEGAFEPGHKYREEFENLTKTFFSNLSPKKYAQLLDKYGVGYINVLLEYNEGMRATMHALLASVVIESWTAFETLAADLWYAALDHGPEEWRKRTGLKSSKFKGGDSELPTSFDLSKIADPQKSYGSFLRDTEKVSFQRLPAIKDWYKTTFGKQIQQKLFAADNYIDALSAVRNVITHKAGVTDRKYVDAVKKFPELNTVMQGKPILLDGEIVRKLRTSAIIVGKELLSFVDNRLANRAKC